MSTVWAVPVAHNRQQALLSLIFSTTPSAARNPVCLSHWWWRVLELNLDRVVPQSAADVAIQAWIRGQVQVGQVTHLARLPEAGLDLFGVDLPADPRIIGPDYCQIDLNGTMLNLDLRGPAPALLGLAGSQIVALERLRVLFAEGAKPVLGARVQANRSLYEPGKRTGDPALVVFTFDPTLQPAYLEGLAQAVFDLKELVTDNPVLRAAAEAPLSNEEEWRYHRRFRLPNELTRGHVVYAGDIWIHRQFLVDGYFSKRQPRMLPLLAQPGERGGLELIPFDRIEHFWPGGRGSVFRSRV